jgi:hypothetical protein
MDISHQHEWCAAKRGMSSLDKLATEQHLKLIGKEQ